MSGIEINILQVSPIASGDQSRVTMWIDTPHALEVVELLGKIAPGAYVKMTGDDLQKIKEEEQRRQTIWHLGSRPSPTFSRFSVTLTKKEADLLDLVTREYKRAAPRVIWL